MLIALKSWLNITNEQDDLLLAYKTTGKKRYLEILVDTHSQDLFHFLRSHSDAELAKDLCQKTWLKTIEKCHLYQEQQTPKAWLFTVARNLMIDELRKQKHTIAFDETLEASSHFEHVETTYSLSEAMAQLPFLQKEALSLQLEGFSLNEIADITHSNVETIKTRLRYAKNQLKQCIGANHE